jgi:hypothetical protein
MENVKSKSDNRCNISWIVVLLLSIFFINSEVHSQTSITYTSNGSWVCPDGVTSVHVEAWGGDAVGRKTNNSNNHAGGAGGGGAYAKRNSISVVPGTAYSFTVGQGRCQQMDHLLFV